MSAAMMKAVMPSARQGRREVRSEVSTQFGQAQLTRSVWEGPLDFVAHSPRHYLQLSFLPQASNGRVRFTDRWSAQRFASVGEMFFYPAGETMHVQAVCSRQQAIACTFDPSAAERFLDRTLAWTDDCLVAGLDLASGTIRMLLIRIGREMQTPGFASETLVELLAGQILVELARHLQNYAYADDRGGLAPWRLKLIEERLHDGVMPPTLNELSSICQISVRHLTRAFRKATGRSIGQYLAEQRIDLAKRLLISSRSIEKVSRQVGFRSPNNFSTAFRRVSGETPRQFLVRSRQPIS